MQEKAYVLITPYSLRKGRAGAILSRLLSRTELSLYGARIYAPDAEFTEKYASAIEKTRECPCTAAYIKKEFAPTADGKKVRFMLLAFEGDDAIAKIEETVGELPLNDVYGAVTIRDSYSEVVRDAEGKIIHVEPAVITAPDAAKVEAELAIFAELSARTENVVKNSAGSVDGMERTLVILKPESWYRPSVRPGAILDIFTQTGLRLVGCKVNYMSVADALAFYGPIVPALREKVGPRLAALAKEMIETKFNVKIKYDINDSVGYAFADDEFERLVEFMSGSKPTGDDAVDSVKAGTAKTMVLVFEGFDPVTKVRTVLGPTDSRKAPGGTVRGEFGTDIMVNAAHASDSQESFQRESIILKIEENCI